jgi:hypothetical protein
MRILWERKIIHAVFVAFGEKKVTGQGSDETNSFYHIASTGEASKTSATPTSFDDCEFGHANGRSRGKQCEPP